MQLDKQLCQLFFGCEGVECACQVGGFPCQKSGTDICTSLATSYYEMLGMDVLAYQESCLFISSLLLASFPGLTPAFVACSTNMGTAINKHWVRRPMYEVRLLVYY